MQNKQIEAVRKLLRQVDSNPKVRNAVAMALAAMPQAAPETPDSAVPPIAAPKMPTG